MSDRDKGIALLLALLLWPRRRKSDVRPAAQAEVDAPQRGDLLEPYGSETVTVTRDDKGAGFIWPVPSMVLANGVVNAAVSSPFGGARNAIPGRPAHVHLGQDIMFPRPAALPRVRGDHGTKDYFAPANTPVIAARAGRVWSTTEGNTGWTVVLDHGKPWSTRYLHLETISIPLHHGGAAAGGGPPHEVEQGDELGIMGWDPMDVAQVRHLHFELYNGTSAVNPTSADQRNWGRKTWRPR